MFEISTKKGLRDTIHTILALQIRFCLLFKRSTNIHGWQN